MTGFQTAQQGKDFFYNEATGRKESCADKCDLPSQYEITCAEKCEFYIPKQRVTTPAFEDLQEANDQTHLFIIAGILIAIVIIILLGVIFRKKLNLPITWLKRTFSRNLSAPQPEVGGGPSKLAITEREREGLMSPNSSQVIHTV